MMPSQNDGIPSVPVNTIRMPWSTTPSRRIAASVAKGTAMTSPISAA